MTMHRACTIILLATLVVASAAADEIRCPDRIATTQSLAQATPGWTDQVDQTSNILAGVTFFEGPPKEMASLAPDESHVKGKVVASFTLTLGAGSQYWLVCGYAGTRVNLARALPKELRTCTVTYDPKQTVDGLPSIERISCK
jgi:hypothetical protein